MLTVPGRAATAAIMLAAVTAGLTACGGSSSNSDGSAGGRPSVSPRPFNTAQTAEIQQCLKAAGIKLPKNASGFNGTPPSNLSPPANGTPPSNFSPPTGAGNGLFGNKKVQQALKACGITLPSQPSR